MVGTQTRNCCRKRGSNDFYGICQEIAANKADIIIGDLTNQKFQIIFIIIIIITINYFIDNKLTIKNLKFLQLISLKKKNIYTYIQSKHYLQVISFHKFLFISIKKNSFRLKMK